MILVLCVDDEMGMAFNGRRQSRDKALKVWLYRLDPRLLKPDLGYQRAIGADGLAPGQSPGVVIIPGDDRLRTGINRS